METTPTLILDQGTKINNTTWKLQEIFTPKQRNTGHASIRVTWLATRVELPAIGEDEIGTIIVERYNNTI